MSKNKKIIAAAVAIIAVIALFTGIYAATRPDTAAGSKSITVQVIHSDESTKEFTYMTDAEYLGEVILNEDLVVGEMGDYGLYISVVDGETADYSIDGSYWALYEGDEYAMQGADQTVIEDGDLFKLVYTIG